MKKLVLTIFIVTALCNIHSYAQGTWSTLSNQSPDANGGVMLLLTDGKVMCMTQTDTIAATSIGNKWNLLTPDSHGSYANGTWSSLPAMNYTRLYFSSQVLPNGNVYVAGGEYGTGGAFGEYYDAITKQWTIANNAPSGNYFYDANSKLLYNGDVLQASVLPNSSRNLIWHAASNSYTNAPSSFGSTDEASWITLPDSSIMNIDLQTQNAERYIPQSNTWVHDAHVPIPLYDARLGEAGSSLLLPNGKVFFLGDSIYTAIYTPSGNSSQGSWVVGPQMPVVTINGNPIQLACPDAPAAMMPNGNILCAFSQAGTYNDTAWFYEYNYLTNVFTPVNTPLGGSQFNGTPSYAINMLDLPDGTVLMTKLGSHKYYQYTPTGSALAIGKPSIDSIASYDCHTFKITGKLFNGIGEGAAYGDDWQMATNYPIVRLTNGNQVYYAKTTNWNRVGAVMTGNLIDSAYFTVPDLMPAGNYSVELIANGNPSNPTTLVYRTLQITTSHQDNVIGNSYCTGSATVAASNGKAPYSVLWALGNQTTDSIINLCGGTYCCTLKDNYGCALQPCITVKDLQPPPFSIYPEPNHGNFTIVGLMAGQKMYLYNDIGQLMNSYVADGILTYIDISTKEDGIYLLTILNLNGSVMKQEKIIKSK